MKNSQPSIWKHTIDNMEIVSTQVPSQQLINVFQRALTSDLEIAACQKLIKVLFRVPMPESRRREGNIHQAILAIAIRLCNSHRQKSSRAGPRRPGTEIANLSLRRENLGFNFSTSRADVEITHEQRYPGKADQSVNPPGSRSGSKDLLNEVHLSKTHKAPVESADDGNGSYDFAQSAGLLQHMAPLSINEPANSNGSLKGL